MTKQVIQFVLVFTLAATAARPQAFGFADPGLGASEAATQAEIAYQKAMSQIDQSHWEAALKQFQDVAARYKDKADAAMYWEAYAQSKLFQMAAALTTLSKFKAAYPASRWLNDAEALQLELRQSSGQKVSPESVGGDDDLKLMALSGLMGSDPERALPILEKTLQGNASGKVKERALFVLSQSDSPAARALVERIARGNSNPDLQKRSLRNIAISGNPRNRQLLAEIYASSSDLEVKREILHAFMLSGDKDRLATAAKGEKSPELRREAIQQLGIMGDQKTLAELYAADSDRQIKEQILQGLFMSGAVDKLIELARNERDPELQKKAINNLGLTGGQKAGDTLVAMYHSSPDRGVKSAVLNALFLQNNGNALVDVARNERDPELQKKAINDLGLTGAAKAGETLVAMYHSSPDRGVKSAVLNALFLQNNGKALVDIARKESNPELKKEAVQKLSLTHTKEGGAYLEELLNK